MIISQSVNARQITPKQRNQHLKLRAHVQLGRIRDEEVSDLTIHGAIRILVEQCESRGEIGRRFIERIHAEAFAAGHGEVGKGFVNTIGLAIVMRKDFGHFD